MNTDPITRFEGEYAFLSNFHNYPVNLQGMEFRTAEHAFQAAKGAFTGYAAVMHIANAPTPADAKRRGRALKIDVAQWDRGKKLVMMEILTAKFGTSPGSGLREKLLATAGRKLVEGNTWGDRYWGAVPVPGTAADIATSMPDASVWAPGFLGPDQWLVGENWLGRLLMMTREIVS